MGYVTQWHARWIFFWFLTTALSSDAQMRSDSADAEMGRANWNDAVAVDLNGPSGAENTLLAPRGLIDRYLH